MKKPAAKICRRLFLVRLFVSAWAQLRAHLTQLLN